MKLLLLSFAIIIEITAYSQSISKTFAENYKKGFVDMLLIEGHIHIENSGTTDVNVQVKRRIFSQTKYSKNNFCWGPICYPDFISESTTPNNILPNEVDTSFLGDYSPMFQEGVTEINYLFYNSENISDSLSHTIVFEALPLPKITGSLTFCSGDQTTLDAGPGYDSYFWSTGATTQTIAVTAGSYSCQVTIDTETRMSDTVTVTQTGNYTPQILGDLSYCENGNTTLDAGAGYAGYLWSGNNQTTQTISATQGTYTVTVTSGNGCTGTASVTVNEVANPSVPDIAWDGAWLSTTATGDYYTWYKDGNIIYGEYSQTYEPEENGNYEVEVCDTSACCCTKSEVEALTNVGLAENPANSNWTMFPNPVKNNLSIQSEMPLESISIHNLVGQQVLFANTNGNRNIQLDVTKLSEGSYVLSLQYGDGNTTQRKFMVSK